MLSLTATAALPSAVVLRHFTPARGGASLAGSGGGSVSVFFLHPDMSEPCSLSHCTGTSKAAILVYLGFRHRQTGQAPEEVFERGDLLSIILLC